jgi:hexosaminidase
MRFPRFLSVLFSCFLFLLVFGQPVFSVERGYGNTFSFRFSYDATYYADSAAPPILQFLLEAEEPMPLEKNRSKIKVTIKNLGRTPLRFSDWTAFFNGHACSVEGVDTNFFKINYLNGDLFQLIPQQQTEVLLPAAQISFWMKASVVKTYTGMPSGFYGVYASSKGTDSQNGSIFPIETIRKAAPSFYRSGLKPPINTAEELFDQYASNASIDSIAKANVSPIFPSPIRWKPSHQQLLLNRPILIVTPTSFVAEAEKIKKLLTAIPYVPSDISIGLHDQTSSSSFMNALGSDTIFIFLQKNSRFPVAHYSMEITPNSIVVEAMEESGIFYAAQSLLSMLYYTQRVNTNAPALHSVSANEMQNHGAPFLLTGRIYDGPAFAYRGFMVDVARNFLPKEFILNVIDVMSAYKMNRLHFHLNDDEGWRLEIPGLPELTEVGAVRNHSGTPVSVAQRSNQLVPPTSSIQLETDPTALPPSYGSGGTLPNAGSGWYSRKDFIDILRYARDRHITVIPELESPGHARAAIQSMLHRYHRYLRKGDTAAATEYLLQWPEDSSKYRSVQGWSDNVMDVSLPSTYRFIAKITEELKAMYAEAGISLTHLHLGGDEVPAGVWQGSPAMKKLLKENPALEKENAVWEWYFQNVSQILEEKGILPAGWEEAGMEFLTKREAGKDIKFSGPNAHLVSRNLQLYVWNNLAPNEDLAYRLANAGFPVVLSNVTHLYFDLAHDPIFEDPGQTWGGYLPLKKTFSFDPLHFTHAMGSSKTKLTAQGKSMIQGIQGQIWTEKINSDSAFFHMMFPRFYALAERAWAPAPDSAHLEEAYRSFLFRISTVELPLRKPVFNYRLPYPGIRLSGEQLLSNHPFPNTVIRYTTNGKTVTANSPILPANMPIRKLGKIKSATPLRIRAFAPDGSASAEWIFVSLPTEKR